MTTTFHKYFRQTANKTLDKIQVHLNEAKQSAEIESIHQIRVESRRLRALFAFIYAFCHLKRIKKLNTKVGRITKIFGSARDLDVKISLLNKYLLNTKNTLHKNNISELIKNLENDRNAMQAGLIKTLNNTQKNTPKYKKLFKSTAKEIKKLCPPESSKHIKIKLLTNRINALKKYQSKLSNYTNTYEIHQTRIAAKKLRYTLENLTLCSNRELTIFIEAAKKIQAILGNFNDAQILVEKLLTETTEKANDLEFMKTSRYLLKKIKADQINYHNEFLAYWEQCRTNSIWENLINRILIYNIVH